MPSKVKTLTSATNSRGSFGKVSRNREAKALGTRAGTLRDWRVASGKSAKASGPRRETMRDGR